MELFLRSAFYFAAVPYKLKLRAFPDIHKTERDERKEKAPSIYKEDVIPITQFHIERADDDGESVYRKQKRNV